MKRLSILLVAVCLCVVGLAQKTKQQYCSSCNGYGTIRCSACEGSGRVQQLQRYGSQTTYVYVSCVYCYGSGKKTCWTCSGNGVIKVTDYDSPDATIQKIWVEHDKYDEYYNEGMEIHVKFSVYGIKGEKGYCNAYFYYSNGNALKSYDKSYSSPNGTVATSETFTPSYESSIFNDFVLFIPYDELHLNSGSHRLKFQVQIFNNKLKAIGESEYYSFSYYQE